MPVPQVQFLNLCLEIFKKEALRFTEQLPHRHSNQCEIVDFLFELTDAAVQRVCFGLCLICYRSGTLDTKIVEAVQDISHDDSANTLGLS